MPRMNPSETRQEAAQRRLPAFNQAYLRGVYLGRLAQVNASLAGNEARLRWEAKNAPNLIRVWGGQP